MAPDRASSSMISRDPEDYFYYDAMRVEIEIIDEKDSFSKIINRMEILECLAATSRHTVSRTLFF